MTDQRLREEIEQVIAQMRRCVTEPDERPNNAVWAWRLDQWADDLASLLSRTGESGTPDKAKTLDRNGRSEEAGS